MDRVTVAQVRAIRDADPNIGLFEAKRQAERDNAMKAVEEAQTVEDLKDVLKLLCRRMR